MEYIESDPEQSMQLTIEAKTSHRATMRELRAWQCDRRRPEGGGQWRGKAPSQARPGVWLACDARPIAGRVGRDATPRLRIVSIPVVAPSISRIFIPVRKPRGVPRRQRKRLASLGERKPLFYWWPRAELNHRHKDFQSSALPTELLGHLNCNGRSIVLPAPAGDLIIPAGSGAARTALLPPVLRGPAAPAGARYCPRNAVNSASVASGNSSAR